VIAIVTTCPELASHDEGKENEGTQRAGETGKGETHLTTLPNRKYHTILRVQAAATMCNSRGHSIALKQMDGRKL